MADSPSTTREPEPDQSVSSDAAREVLDRALMLVDGEPCQAYTAEGYAIWLTAVTNRMLNAILNDSVALGQSLSPAQLRDLLRGAESVGVVQHVGYQWLDPGYGPDGGLMPLDSIGGHTDRMKPVYRVVDDD